MSQKDYVTLRTYWYAKLKKSGFKDIELMNGQISDWPRERLERDWTPEQRAEKQEYFRVASQMYWEYKFKNKIEKQIWWHHCEGLSYREIAEKLRTPANKINKDNVQTIVNALSKIARARLYDNL